MLLLTLLIVFVFTSCDSAPVPGPGPDHGPSGNNPPIDSEPFDPKDPIRDDDWWDGDKTGGNHFAIPKAVREYLKSLFSRYKGEMKVVLVKGDAVVGSCYVREELDVLDFLDTNLSSGQYELRVYQDGDVEMYSFLIE